MKKAYIVIGMTGEYSDRQYWPVIIYKDENSAKEHVVNATNRARELYGEYEKRWDIPKDANKYDLHMMTDYTGTTYSYWEVPFDA